jgi:hypothetical protein
VSVFLAVAATLSPLASTASVRLRPNPRELPVINQIFVIALNFIYTKVARQAGDGFVERLNLFC